MSVLINSFGNCQTNIKGTGIPICTLDSIGDYLGMGLLQKGTSFDITNKNVLIDETVIDGLIKSRKLHQLINKLEFTGETPENEVFTDATGLEKSVRDGKTKFTTMYDGSLHRLSAIHSYKGHNRWDALLYFQKGVLMTANVGVTKAKGFTIGRFDVSSIKFLKGTDVQQISTIAQFTKPDEINQRFIFRTWESLGVDLSEKQGVIDTVVEVVTPPIATGLTMSVKVTLAENTDSTVLGLESILAWATGGTQTTPKNNPTTCVYNANTGLYDLGFASAFIVGDTFKPRLITGSNNVYEDGYGMFYAGESVLGTI